MQAFYHFISCNSSTDIKFLNFFSCFLICFISSSEKKIGLSNKRKMQRKKEIWNANFLLHLSFLLCIKPQNWFHHRRSQISRYLLFFSFLSFVGMYHHNTSSVLSYRVSQRVLDGNFMKRKSQIRQIENSSNGRGICTAQPECKQSFANFSSFVILRDFFAK